MLDDAAASDQKLTSTSVALVMKGGGIKGLAYVGAVRKLSTHYNFQWFVGTSAGAITAILLAAGYSVDELEEILRKKNFSDFFDAPWYAKPYNLLVHGGLHHAKEFTDWMDELLAQKLSKPTRARLSDLPHRVTIYASKRDKGALVFDSETADADAAYAARCSISIPIVFVPQAEQGIQTYDGGLQHNYPIDQLLQDNPHAEFISLFLGPETYEPPKRRFGVLSDVLAIWTEGRDAEALDKYRDRTVIIDPRPIGTLDFAIGDEEKNFLLSAGRAAAIKHLRPTSDEVLRSSAVRDRLRRRVESHRREKQRSRRKRLLAVALGGLVSLLAGAAAFCWWLAGEAAEKAVDAIAAAESQGQFKVAMESADEVARTGLLRDCLANIANGLTDHSRSGRNAAAIAHVQLGGSSKCAKFFASNDAMLEGGTVEFIRDARLFKATLDNFSKAVDENLQLRNRGPALYTLLLALGEYSGADGISQFRKLHGTVKDLYIKAPEREVHSASGWLLRKWISSDEVDRLDQQLAQQGRNPENEWFVRQFAEGVTQTFVVIPPKIYHTPYGTWEIHREYALADREMTQRVYEALGGPVDKTVALDAPVHFAPWPPIEEKIRNGLGLPNIAEWNVAAAAGRDRWPPTTQAYSNLDRGQRTKPLPIGQRVPNRWGFIDAIGNVQELVDDEGAFLALGWSCNSTPDKAESGSGKEIGIDPTGAPLTGFRLRAYTSAWPR